MSAEANTRLVQRAYEAFGHRDMAAFVELMADDIEWVDPGDPDDDPNAGTFNGKEAPARAHSARLSSYWHCPGPAFRDDA